MADDELAPFIIESVKEPESIEKKGSGAYGTVYKVTVKGVTCIDKRLHDILVKPEVPRRQRKSIREKFCAECITLSKLRHPHIVHFVGVRCGSNPNDLSLVMECLHTDLAKFLDDHQEKGVDIPLPIKLSILLDVSYGLLYLHTLTPPIIHRDLSANNVLLTADGLQAKIADLGVSKLLDLETQTKIAQTKVPGSQNYMPPEALTENPQYGLKLDVFSFGHLMLYTATQEFPGVHEVTLTPSILQQGLIQIVKRGKSISKMGGERHCLHSLVLQCLQDKPEKRPTTLKLNDSLKEHCTKHPRSMAEVLQLFGEADLAKPQIEEGKQTDDSTRKLELENRQLSERLNKLSADRNAVINELKVQVRRLEQEKEALQNEVQIAKTEAQLEQVKQREELEQESKQLSEQLSRMVKSNADGTAVINELKAQVRELDQQKESLQNELQIAKTEAQLYREDFALERHDREVAHGMIADLQRKYAYDVGKLRDEQEEHIKARLAEVEHVFQKREKEMRIEIEEVAKKKNQQELQTKTTQLKQYKKRVDTLKDQLTDMEGRNKELSKERDKLFRELDKTRKELIQAKTKTEAEKPKKDGKRGKKEAKRKLSLKGATSPDPTEVSKALEEKIAQKEHLYEELRDENDTLQAELEECRRANAKLKTLLMPRPESLLLEQSCESSQSPLTSPRVDPGASHPGLQPPRILEEDEEIEQEKIKQTLDSQFHKQRQLLHSVEEQTYTKRAGTLSDSSQAIPLPAECFHEHPSASGHPAQPPQPYIAPTVSHETHDQDQPSPLLSPKPTSTPPTPPVESIECIHYQPLPVDYDYIREQLPLPVEHPPACGFAAQLNLSREAQPYIDAAVQPNNQQPPPPRPPKPSSPSLTISPRGSEISPLHGGGLPGTTPPYSQQIPQDSHMGAPGIPPPQAHACPQTPPVHHWDEFHPLSTQNPPQTYGGTEVPHHKPIPKRHSISIGGEYEQRLFQPQDQQANEIHAFPTVPSGPHEHLRSPSEDQYSIDESDPSTPLLRNSHNQSVESVILQSYSTTV